jgi:hypothetical protein
MIGQRSTSLSERKEIYNYGCYFMSLTMMAWEHGQVGSTISPGRIITGYDALIKSGAMRKDCYIESAQAIVDYWGGKLKFLGKFAADYELADDEVAVELWKLKRPAPKEWWYHFVYGTYDPWVKSKTRAFGELDSYRVFKQLIPLQK